MVVDVPTGGGLAQVEWVKGRSPRFLLALTHGSAGDVDAPDLLTARDIAVELGGAVALVRQPYRVAGRRAPGAAGPQDAAWLDVVAALRAKVKKGLPFVQGGRSNGARVACRTALAADAVGVIALSFPLHPPGKPERTRVEELRAAPAVLVVNGARDPFGIPDPADALEVRVIPGQAHSYRAGFAEIGDAIRPWLIRWTGERQAGGGS